MPVYPLTKGLSNKTIQKACVYALNHIDSLPDFLDEGKRKELGLLSVNDALMGIHCPHSDDEFRKSRKRIAFDEFFWFLYQIRQNREEQSEFLIREPLLPVADPERLIEMLPYELTADQKKAWHEIETDMEKKVPMNRLLQGDVGSGKTVIAFLTLLKACANGRQGCLMAPTEVLAEQHFRGLAELCRNYHLCIKPVLLLGSMGAKEKREAKQGIKDGSYNVIIGTHAVIQKSVEYKNLAVVITDEQHRFGVNQREALRRKGDAVHVLVMSATPIPRTLALILYGDLSISTIKELPSSRLPVKNCVIDESYRKKAMQFLKKEIRDGHQAYVICPLVEMSETLDELENVIDYTEKLKNIFDSDIRIACLHGKMSFQEKEEIMNQFSLGNIDILVATTVIEVGINVPNATVMMIENAERYGLAQLHQLRGRVGRGNNQSYCIFMSGSRSKKNEERLDILNHSNDGFEIANRDLELRGPGQLGGIQQSGDLGFSVADIYEDRDMLILANEYADTVLNSPEETSFLKNYSSLQVFGKFTDKIETL